MVKIIRGRVDAAAANASNPPMATPFRASDLRFLGAWVLPGITLANAATHPEWAAVGAFTVWMVMAGAEAAVPALRHSPAAATARGWLPWVLRFYVPLQLLLLATGLLVARSQGWWTVAGLAFACGFVTGAQGITFAHELGHSRSPGDRTLGWVLMASVAYPQFMVEHFRGHHVRVATWDDPASARRGESLWRFLPRTLLGSARHAWQLEREQCARLRRPLLVSPLFWCWLVAGAFVLLLAALGEWKALAFWAAQSAFAVWLLETVNYIEHYGLSRAPGKDGRPGPFGMRHAWNADHLLSNSVLANLQRHSDHHLHAWKPYPELDPLPGPQLPTGYAGCLLLASVPPLWFRTMDTRLAAVEAV
jgi:alkane 1-monooxygenase